MRLAFRKIVKWVKLILFGAIALAIVIPVSLGLIKKTIDNNSIPSATKAPYVIQTSSRIYLAEKYSVVAGVPTAVDYWYLQGSKYYFVSGVITFPVDEYGAIQVEARY